MVNFLSCGLSECLIYFFLDELIRMGYIEQLIGQIAIQMQQERNDDQARSSEHLLSALLSLIQNHEESQEICKRSDLQFKEILNCIIENTKDKDEYRVSIMFSFFGILSKIASDVC